MKRKNSFIIGGILLVIAVLFISYAMQHPELSFPWSLRFTYMLYGAYIWLLFQFLLDIPIFRRMDNRVESGNQIVRAVIYGMMAVVFLLMELTGKEINGFTILRGFIVAGGCEVAVESLYLWWRNEKCNKKK